MISNSISPGPGVYERKETKKRKKNSEIRSKSQNKEVHYKHLKDMVLKVLEVPEDEEKEEKKEKEKEVMNDHMFVIDERDRFGERMFPLLEKRKVPGPGAYEPN